MLKFYIHAIGKLKNAHISELILDYKKRMVGHLEIREFELKKANNLSTQAIKEHEAKLLLADIPDNACVIAMDETGMTFSSREFAGYISRESTAGFSSFVFIIGGADGLHDIVRKSAHKIFSLGRITLPHMLARLVLVEQIYRAERIMANHPYDK
ncbi:MAG: 23S rRNA (pseudouridine(1915)-N(3))-methyltransferase RlmH [Alphaproteobacteria bacterium]|nr:23S rRNA (pseudouridine(1915)-N(3))-methyltransferase RlmH [Alphaproteobacteria bacterium]